MTANLTLAFASLVCALAMCVHAYAESLKDFKTDFPDLIGVWRFDANPGTTKNQYQIAIWAQDAKELVPEATGILTWNTCRTGIGIVRIPREQVGNHKITQEKELLEQYEFFKLEDQPIFKTGYCSNAFFDQWPDYLLREVSTGRFFSAGYTIDAQRLKELQAIYQRNRYEVQVMEQARRQAGEVDFKRFSELKRSRPDSSMASALKYAQERLRYAAEIAHARQIFDDPSARYGAAHVATQKLAVLQEYLPHQPDKIVSVAEGDWAKYESGASYARIANGTGGGPTPGDDHRFHQGFVSLIRAYGHYCKATLKKWPTVSFNYQWVETNKHGVRKTETVLDEPVVVRKRYVKSFDQAFRESRKVKLSTGMLNPNVLWQKGLARGALDKKIAADAYRLVDSEGCDAPTVLQLLENYHRKQSGNSPSIQEVDGRLKKAK